MSILDGALSGIASAGAQQLFTDYNRQQDFGNYMRAQEENWRHAQEAQFNAPLQTKLGMVAAGLNPAAMNNPTPASAPSAPLGSHDSPKVDLAQDNNLMADARLKNAEAEKTELQNDNMRGENESSFATYVEQLDALINAYKFRGWTQQADVLEEERARLNELKSQGKLNFNVGNLRGAVNAYSTVQALQERLTNTFDELLKTETNFKMLVNGQSVPLSKMPETQRRLLLTQISNNIATNALLASQKNLTDEQKNELVKLQEKLTQDIELAKSQKQLTDYQANSIYLADWKQLLNDKEFIAAAIAKADETQKIILEQTGHIVGAVVQAKAGKEIAKGMKNARSSQGNQSTTIQHYGPDGRSKGVDVIHGEKTMLNRSIPSWQDSEW